jgi:hypothetical protein
MMFICEKCKNASFDQESFYTPAYVDDCNCGNSVLDEEGEPIEKCDDFEPCEEPKEIEGQMSITDILGGVSE